MTQGAKYDLIRKLRLMSDISVRSIDELYGIPTYRRKWGVLVAVYDDSDDDDDSDIGVYRLVYGLSSSDLKDNDNWEKLDYGSSLPEATEDQIAVKGSESWEAKDYLKYWHNINSAARLWGGIISDNGNGTVTVAAGAGLVKGDEAGPESKPTDVNQGQGSKLSLIEWAENDNVALADNEYNFIYVDHNGDVKATTDFYSISFTRDFTVGRVYRTGNEVLIRLCGTNAWNFNRRTQLFGEEVFPIIRAWGLLLSDEGSRQFRMSEGVLWAELVNRFTVGEKVAATNFKYWYYDGSWQYDEVNQINNAQYNDTGTGKEDFGGGPNRWRADFVFVDHTGVVHVIMGQAEYRSRAGAETHSVPADLPGVVTSYGSLIGRCVIQKATDDLFFYSAFDTVFSFQAVEQHNELAGLQGGQADEYYHLTGEQHGNLLPTATEGQIAIKGEEDWEAGEQYQHPTGFSDQPPDDDGLVSQVEVNNEGHVTGAKKVETEELPTEELNTEELNTEELNTEELTYDFTHKPYGLLYYEI